MVLRGQYLWQPSMYYTLFVTILKVKLAKVFFVTRQKATFYLFPDGFHLLFGMAEIKNVALWDLFLFFLRFYLFIFRQRGREGERNVTVWLPLESAPTGDLAWNPGMCLDWEANWWPFGLVTSQGTLWDLLIRIFLGQVRNPFYFF